MENLIKFIVGAAFIVVVSYLGYRIFELASSDTYLKLSAEIASVESGNKVIAERNALLKTRIEALRTDSRAIERKCRDELGMARSDEIILLFKKDQ